MPFHSIVESRDPYALAKKLFFQATTGISNKTLTDKLKLLRRQSNSQNYENINELKKEYDYDVTEIAQKQLLLQGKINIWKKVFKKRVKFFAICKKN